MQIDIPTGSGNCDRYRNHHLQKHTTSSQSNDKRGQLTGGKSISSNGTPQMRADLHGNCVRISMFYSWKKEIGRRWNAALKGDRGRKSTHIGRK